LHVPQQVAIFSTANASTVLQQAGLGRLEVVLCSYDQLRLHGSGLAEQVAPHIVIFDEVGMLLLDAIAGNVLAFSFEQLAASWPSRWRPTWSYSMRWVCCCLVL
jgi:hypothetical protein